MAAGTATPGQGASSACPGGAGGDPAAGIVPPVVRSAWGALDDASIRWALLRGRADATDGDIDVLVDRSVAGSLDRVLAAVGYARLPAIGHGDHRFYRAYDEAADRWATLDVVTELAFAPGGRLPLPGAAGAVLEGRIVVDGTTRLQPDDAFWALLLHDLLDRGDIPDAHLAELGALVEDARPDGPLGHRVDALGGPGSAGRLIDFVRRGDTAAARSDGRRLGRRWARAMPAETIRRGVGHAVQRRLRKPWTAIRRRGIDVAVLGPDGAGKSTLAASLAGAFPVSTRTIYLGLYGSGLGGTRRFGLVQRLARLWRGWLAGLWHRLRGRLVVYDRHVLDILVAPSRRSPKARLRHWVLRHAIPDPALVLVLDAPADLLFARKGEHDVATIDAQRRGYLDLARHLPGAEVIDVTRDPDAVRREAIGRIWRRMSGSGRRD